MLKKILYTILAIAIIIILGIMWKNTRNDDLLAPVANQNTSTNTDNEEVVKTEEPSTSEELDAMDINSGIDTDLSSMSADIETL